MQTLTLPLSLSVLALVIPAAAAAQPFTDITPSRPDAEAIAYVQEQDIMTGYADGTFRPDRVISRGEFVKILVDNLNPLDDAGCTGDARPFTDVAPNTWEARALCVAKNLGMVHGYADGSFRPDQAIILTEAAAILSEKFALDSSAFSSSFTGPDGVARRYWFKPSIDALANLRAIPIDIQFLTSRLTRGQAAQMLERLARHVQTEQSTYFGNLWRHTAYGDASAPVIFDSCGGIAAYKNENWFPTLAAQATARGLTLDANSVSDACLSTDGTALVFIAPNAVMPATLWRYDVRSATLRLATRTDDFAGFFAAQTFGKRVADSLPVTGSVPIGGGCLRSITSTYDADRNTVAVTDTHELCDERKTQ